MLYYYDAHSLDLYICILITTVKGCIPMASFAQVDIVVPRLQLSLLSHHAMRIDKNPAGRKYSGILLGVAAPEGEACIDTWNASCLHVLCLQQ